MIQDLSNYLICSIHYKDLEQYSYVCLAQTCSAKLLCRLCLNEHKNHPTVTILSLIRSAQEMGFDNTLAQRIQDLKKYQVQCLTSIQNLRKEMESLLKESEVSVTRYFREIDVHLRDILIREEMFPPQLYQFRPERGTESLSLQVSNLRTQFLDRQKTRAELAVQLSIAEADLMEKTKSNMANSDLILPEISHMINRITRAFSNRPQSYLSKNSLQTALKNSTQIQKKFETILVEIAAKSAAEIRKNPVLAQNRAFLLNQSAPELEKPVSWSTSLKHGDIKINGLSVVRSVMSNSKDGWSVCCLTESLPKKWSVKIGHFQRVICVGICQVRQAQQNHFEEWCWKEIGHGQYCVHSNGMVYSHSDPNVNSKLKSFKFITGDILQLEYNRVEGKLKINKSNQSYQMNVEKGIQNKYAYCVYLPRIGDSVTLINQ